VRISQDAVRDLRAANLAHLLAISGFIWAAEAPWCSGRCARCALRAMLALVPEVALQWPTAGMAAAGALICGPAVSVAVGRQLFGNRTCV